MDMRPLQTTTNVDLWKVKVLNGLHGNLAGKPCPNCMDKGYTVFLRGGYIIAQECTCLAGRMARKEENV